MISIHMIKINILIKYLIDFNRARMVNVKHINLCRLLYKYIAN
jgi:hypothetical protein